MSPPLGRRPDDAARAAEFLKRLGNPGRMAIVARLREGEMTVAEMETELGLRQPSLSQQLADLRAGGIVEARREAKSVRYRLTDDRAKKVVDLCDLLFGPAPGRSATGAGQDTGAPPTARASIGAAVFARVGASLPPRTDDAAGA
ncbi:ArsR/SmtB family transcription factor [Aureimonas sp. N4]|uniref:ArsR/SmtB family transcription factor n=1 Tax=Aureimonas sp. N4 TaxID=1638165 RepID=UPI0009E75620|nr:metalloregulator ArsR/SmtB family transcription factor [Aureimonas sp. N4]